MLVRFVPQTFINIQYLWGRKQSFSYLKESFSQRFLKRKQNGVLESAFILLLYCGIIARRLIRKGKKFMSIVWEWVFANHYNNTDNVHNRELVWQTFQNPRTISSLPTQGNILQGRIFEKNKNLLSWRFFLARGGMVNVIFTLYLIFIIRFTILLNESYYWSWCLFF